MKKSTYLFSIVLLFFFGLIACQQQPKSVITAKSSKDSATATNINEEIKILCENKGWVGPPERGAKVAYHLAEKCFKEYDRVMKKHCFLTDADEVRRGNAPMQGRTNKCNVDSFRMITGRKLSGYRYDVLACH